ncbi:hypothetical protein BpHYR1_020521 [Brachionus plicatilis]|uniref:Uncharacterized protein n=1 Tax=Brachionus plicatilis TaxID=10195 RepID=A0A3M7RLF8_BRAPC|nr:hypothetical protein BpHYR1_020521 [Brachionus plicatilis]
MLNIRYGSAKTLQLNCAVEFNTCFLHYLLSKILQHFYEQRSDINTSTIKIEQTALNQDPALKLVPDLNRF